MQFTRASEFAFVYSEFGPTVTMDFFETLGGMVV
jgi:hypothetical protein